jgi:hypothetical protein
VSIIINNKRRSPKLEQPNKAFCTIHVTASQPHKHEGYSNKLVSASEGFSANARHDAIADKECFYAFLSQTRGIVIDDTEKPESRQPLTWK